MSAPAGQAQAVRKAPSDQPFVPQFESWLLSLSEWGVGHPSSSPRKPASGFAQAPPDLTSCPHLHFPPAHGVLGAGLPTSPSRALLTHPSKCLSSSPLTLSLLIRKSAFP